VEFRAKSPENHAKAPSFEQKRHPPPKSPANRAKAPPAEQKARFSSKKGRRSGQNSPPPDN
jgi:hypothetical protein